MTALNPHRNAILSIAIAALFTGATGTFCLSSWAQPAATPSVRPGEPVTLNFAGAEIEAVARTMATITGRNVVVDPRVKGTLNLSTERAVRPEVAFEQFLAALRLQGYTVVEQAGLYKVVPEADAKLQGGSVSVTQGGAIGARVAGNQIVTQIFKLNFENAANLVPVLRPLISPNNTINVNPGTNALVITDYADNLQRMARIIAAMDVSNASDVEVIPLKNALASDLAPLVQKLIDTGTASTGAQATGAAATSTGQTDAGFKTTLLAEPRSNALILRAANPARVAQVRALVDKLDQPPAPGSSAANGNIHVVYLKNADATKLAVTLRAALAASLAASGSGSNASGAAATAGSASSSTSSSNFGASSSMGSSSTTGSTSGVTSAASTSSLSSPQPSTGGPIQADPSTNSLIITAPEPQFRQLRAVIDQLDGRRAQVLVESLIVEVSANKVAEFGVQWQTALGNSGNGVVGAIGTNSSVAGDGANILNLATSIASGTLSTLPASGFNIALAPRINGKYYLGALANFLENTGDANVLSTPNLLTLDNEEARIIIGSNVPFVTGSYATTSGSSTVSPFTTVTRQDVGLTLRVRPQINENGTVKMSIYQEVSSVDSTTTKDTNGPTTRKRSIESNVLVEDGSIIVLGGLLQDDYALTQDKVPGLGDIPYLGALFRSEKRTRNKTNLMVFLRPVVVRDGLASEALSVDRYEAIRALQQNIQPSQNPVMNAVSAAPVLPPMRLPLANPAADDITPIVPAPLPPAVTTP
ncbi:MAG TPA: type II secretion system secretin GspD [Burkholderiaceae bacterium]